LEENKAKITMPVTHIDHSVCSFSDEARSNSQLCF